ncbi:MAG TPA: DinB family protein [Tepidisphaeraceae bacterium]|jgi:hypothetical protein|nr:DinB family protein [Tepidisphaeraceae bacterium]
MLDLFRQTIANQYGAALKMLEDCIGKCQPDQWMGKVGKVPFWHVSYHVLFCTDMYLSSHIDQFRPQAFHRESYNFLEREPFPPFKQVVADQPYEKPILLGYVDTCRNRVVECVKKETESTLAGPSGFHWIPFSRAELHLYNLRHIQHHMGALNAFLARTQGKGAAWVGTESLL